MKSCLVPDEGVVEDGMKGQFYATGGEGPAGRGGQAIAVLWGHRTERAWLRSSFSFRDSVVLALQQPLVRLLGAIPVSHRTKRTLAAVGFVIAGLALSAVPATAVGQHAQARAVAVPGPAHGPVHGPVAYHYAYPYYWRSIWWASYGYPWGFYAYGYPYGYPYAYPFPYAYFPADVTAAVRLQVTPREAEVYVDGYRAGEVDDFDGVFQRLRLQPGGHEIAVYLEGYRTYRQSLYVNPGSSQSIRHELEHLAPGETNEPRPSPSDARPAVPPDGSVNLPNDAGPGARPPDSGRTREEAPRAFGTLSLRVQPADADVLVDGQRWNIPAGSTAFEIELSAGRHTVEISKAGFTTYRETVLIRPGATMKLNVGLAQ